MMDTWTHPFLTNWFQSCVLPCAWTFLENILQDITKTIWITCKKYLAATCDMSDCLIRGLETICTTLYSIVTDLTPCQYLRRKNILNQLFPAQTHRPRSSLTTTEQCNQDTVSQSKLFHFVSIAVPNIRNMSKYYFDREIVWNVAGKYFLYFIVNTCVMRETRL